MASAALGVLAELAPPPDTPAASGSDSEWLEVERHFGFAFPADYKALIARYGTGCWGEFLWVLNPFSRNRYTNQRLIMGGAHLWCEEEPEPPSDDPRFLQAWSHFRRGARARRTASPYPFFPHRPGLFPWAHGPEDVVSLYWLTEGDSESWPVVIEIDPNGPHFGTPIRVSCTEFISQWIRGEFVFEGFPAARVDEQGKWFVPWRFDLWTPPSAEPVVAPDRYDD